MNSEIYHTLHINRPKIPFTSQEKETIPVYPTGSDNIRHVFSHTVFSYCFGQRMLDEQ